MCAEAAPASEEACRCANLTARPTCRWGEVAVPAIDAAQQRWVQPPGVRLVASVVLASMLGCTAWAFALDGTGAMQIVSFTGPLALAAVGAFRQGVEVLPGEIVICNGIATWRVPRGDVVRLQWCSARQVGWPAVFARRPQAGSLYLVRASGRPVAVPQTSVRDVVRPRGRSVAMATWFSQATSLEILAGHVDEPDELGLA